MLFFLITSLGLGGFVGFLWWTAPAHRINVDSVEQLNEGMTEKEVESILRVPAGDYETSTIKPMTYPSSDLRMPIFPVEEKVWKGGGLVVRIWFDEAGVVVDKRITGSISETFFDKMRRLVVRR